MIRFSWVVLTLLFMPISYANISCMPDNIGCSTRLGTLTSEKINDEYSNLYLNGRGCLKLNQIVLMRRLYIMDFLMKEMKMEGW